MQGKPLSIDDYLARLPADRRAALEQLRRTILALLPRAEECISYSMPAFRHEGHVVAGFLATAKGCSFYPFSGTTLATLADEVRAYGQTKSALHFDPQTPLPRSLVKKLIMARLEEEAARARTKPAPARARQAAGGGTKRVRKKARPSGKRATKKRARR
jgi:uncharacterized protein YdhG (YjbR/CyaY superfamily)